MRSIPFTMNKNIISIRRATIKDLDKLVRFEKQIADYHYAFDKIYKPGRKILGIKNYYRSLLKKREHKILILLNNGYAVGFASAQVKKMRPVFSVGKMGHINTVFVESKYRKIGLGKLAIDEFVLWFRSNNISIVDLSVDVKNTGGVLAWNKLGFKNWRLILRRKI